MMLPADAHLDPRFRAFPNLPEDRFQSILAVPILSRHTLEGALNVRTIAAARVHAGGDRPALAIAAQVAHSIQHARMYAAAQRRVDELEALARISEAVSDSLYLEESLAAIVRTTMDALGATGAALVLDDGEIAWPEGRAGAYAERLPLRWRGRQIGELVCDRDTPFSDDDRQLLVSIAHHAAVALEHGRAVMRGVLAQEIHHRVKNNLQTVASLLRLQARATDGVDPREALEHSVNRILAIAAVHEVLTERREDDVARRVARPAARDARAGNRRRKRDNGRVGARAGCAGGVAGDGAGACLQRAPAERARARRRGRANRARAAERGRPPRHRRLGRRPGRSADGTGLSIVRALVRDELNGRFELLRGETTRAEVVFPGVRVAICGKRCRVLHNLYA